LTLTGNIASTALTIAIINEQIAATKEIINEDHKNFQLVDQAFRLGATTRTEVLSAQSQEENDEALLPPLYQQLVVAKDMLTVLMGKFPANWAAPNFKLSDFVLPKKLTLSLPSELVHKRPDIIAAESMLHAANADVGIATANLYPAINLSGALMQEALSPSNLFKASSNAWNVLGGVTAPIFNGGTLRAERKASIHAYQSAYANYQQVIVKAFAQVNVVLHALRHDEQAILLQKRALATAQASLHLARLSYNAGNVGILQVLDAERLYTQAKLGYVQAAGQQYLDTIQLYIALGSVPNGKA
jgi:NodT family efflux transporter outer membrane factor (OMF) lipoprotein